GTIITNQAVVYFPSVPETTPTNLVVNVVEPLKAQPQTVHTPATRPVSIQLTGVDAGGAQPTYVIVDQPLNGQLSGTAPNLTYAPPANFTGEDHFTFEVRNGPSASRPARVEVIVDPSSLDTTPPAVLWTDPVTGTRAVPVSAKSPITDSAGPAYGPRL